jgi:hypothetical protein
MKIQDGDVLPGIGVGNIKLDITKEELIEIIGENYKQSPNGSGGVISVENASFWIAEDGRVNQIGVGGDFKGKYKGKIGIGSTLKDVKEYIGDYKAVYSTYEVEQDKGICFELEDIEDWDELTAPIEYIYVFRVD